MKHQACCEHRTTRQPLQGLSTHEVAVRRAAGKGAVPPPPTDRTYAQIIREDVFTLINNLLFVLCTALLLLGQISQAVVSAGAVLFNVVISVAQEIRAKRALDRIALLTRPRATVIRDGQEQPLDPGALVQDDLLVLHPGDQVVVDGPVIGEGRVEIDESLLTGESEPIMKKVSRQREDFARKTANALVSSHDFIIFLLMAFAGTVGQTGTSSDEENASGQPASTRLSRKRKTGKRAR